MTEKIRMKRGVNMIGSIIEMCVWCVCVDQETLNSARDKIRGVLTALDRVKMITTKKDRQMIEFTELAEQVNHMNQASRTWTAPAETKGGLGPNPLRPLPPIRTGINRGHH